MKYKLNLQYYFSIDKTFEDTQGKDTFSTVLKIVSLVLSGIALIIWGVYIYITLDLPSSGQPLRIFLLLPILFIYGSIHKKPTNK